MVSTADCVKQKNQSTQSQGSRTHPMKAAKKKKKELKKVKIA